MAAAGALLLSAFATAQAQVRVGSTFTAIAGDGATKRFPDIAFDNANNAYLVVTGQQKLEARYVDTDGTLLGSVAVLTTTGGAVRAVCAASLNKCLVAWLHEKANTADTSRVVGQFVRFNGGSVQLLGNSFTIGTSGLLTNSAPGLAYSGASSEFLVVWTDGVNNLRARRVDADGTLLGSDFFYVTNAAIWEGFPTLAYNTQQDEYLVAYYCEPGGKSGVCAQRVKPGTGALIGASSILYSGGFSQYPEVAYNTATNQYLAITWGFSNSAWMLKGRLADGNAQPLGASTIALAAKGGGDGIGLGYNPVSNTFLADYQSQTNAETWGVEIGPAGGPGTQIQLSYSGTTLSVQPRAEANPGTDQWLMVMSKGFANITAQVVGHDFTPAGTGGGTGCSTPSPGTGYTCVNGVWVPPSTGGTSGCTTAKPAANWVCVGSNWLPPWMVPPTSSCTTPKPGPNFVCVNGNWLPDNSTSDGTCTTVKPAANWVCKNGNWLPPWY